MNTSKLLEEFYSGDKPIEKMLEQFLEYKIKEDLYLEYKNAGIIQRDDGAAAEIRKYVSGFANSDGGIFFIGVDEKEFKVVNTIPPGGGDLSEWASRCLTPIATHFSTPPRIFNIKHKDGNVLAIVVDRSINLIPVTEKNVLVYYMRFNDQTLGAPEYLVADVLLSRKARPYLQITHYEMINHRLNGQETFTQYETDLTFDISIRVENQSLVWADDIKAGLIAKVVANPDKYLEQHLLSYLEIEQENLVVISPVAINHKGHDYQNHRQDLTPFSSVNFKISNIKIPFLTSYPKKRYQYTWRAALYLLSRNSPPVWYQVDIPITPEFDVDDLPKKIDLNKITNQRPIVSLK